MNEHVTDSLYWLNTDTLEVGFDPQSGAIAALRSTSGSWAILDRPNLGLSFRLLVPLPDRRMNYVEGVEQQPPAISWSEDRRTLNLHWESVTSEHGGEHPIGVHISVAAVERR